MAMDAMTGFNTVMGLKKTYDEWMKNRPSPAPKANTDGTHDHLGEHANSFADGHTVIPEDKYGP